MLCQVAIHCPPERPQTISSCNDDIDGKVGLAGKRTPCSWQNCTFTQKVCQLNDLQLRRILLWLWDAMSLQDLIQVLQGDLTGEIICPISQVNAGIPL